MRFLRRPGRPDQASADLSTLVLQGEDMIGELTEAHLSWGIGTNLGWDIDLRSGLLTWRLPGGTAIAPVQVIGTFDPATTSWLWAWANNSIPPMLAEDSRLVHEWAEANGHAGLTQPRIEADLEKATSMAALALRVTDATGYFRGDGGDTIPFLTFGPVTLTAADGTSSTFQLEVG
jgi:hypothetical protein